MHNLRSRFISLYFLALAGLMVTTLASAGDVSSSATSRQPSYAYATNGLLENVHGPFATTWKLLLNETNLGGKELEAVEVTMPPGTPAPLHLHGVLEIIYVLSGTFEHEVNGKRFRLTPGMIGIVRPGDHVRHIVPKSRSAKLLIIWAPGSGGNTEWFEHAKGDIPKPVAQVSVRDPS